MPPRRFTRVAVAALLATPRVLAEEVIEDPELAKPAESRPVPSGTKPAESGRVPSGTAGVTEDAPLGEAAPGSLGFEPPIAEPPLWRVVLHSRWGVDTKWRWPSEDVLEGTTIGVVEVEQRQSDALKYSVGLRARHGYATRENGDARYEFDVAPVSAFADVTMTEGAHLRAGYQVISLGRFDVFSATNFLAVVDLRSGPGTMPDALQVAQPALRFDLDKIRGFTLQAFYVPFFQPHVVSAYGGDYALLTSVDRSLDRADEEQRRNPPAGMPPPPSAPRDALERGLGRSGVAYGARHGFAALAPDPSLNEPQGAVRATVHGSAGELSATFGTALERLPVFVFGPALLAYLDAGQPSGPLQAAAEAEVLGGGALRIDHPRFAVASLDAATDVGPIQIGVEGAFVKDRTLAAAAPGLATRQEAVDIAQGGLRAEFMEGTSWVVAAEGFGARPLRDPRNAGLRWLGFEQNGWGWGVAAGIQWAPEESGLRFELGGLVSTGPSYVGIPRAEWEALPGFYVEVGGVVVEGPTVPVGGSPTSVGSLFDDADQVFVGLRWLP